MQSDACDGFILVPHLTPRGLDEFVDEVVPLLQERGSFRTEYDGLTLRDHLRPARSAGYARPGAMLSQLTVGWLILRGGRSLTFVGGSGCGRSSAATATPRRSAGSCGRSGNRRSARVLYGPIASDALDPDELDQTILMPTIVSACGLC